MQRTNFGHYKQLTRKLGFCRNTTYKIVRCAKSF